jgi:hypothetical protein
MVALCCVAIPLGAVRTSAMIRHFNAHLTTVITATNEDGEQLVHRPDIPEVPRRQVAMSRQLELLQALEDAEPVSAAELVSRGELRIDENGELVPTFDLEDAMREAALADEIARQDEEREAEEARDAELVERWRGGRLFSR